MKVAVMGAGSIGGYFGGMLARAGHDVTLIARGDHLDAILRYGLIMQTQAGEFTVPCSATDQPDDSRTRRSRPAHHQDLPQRRGRAANGAHDRPNTAILCLQNGIDSYLPLVDAFPEAAVLPGAAYIEAGRSGPGVVTQAGDIVRIVTGGIRGSDPSHQAKAETVCAAFRDANVNAEASDDIAVTLWTKFLFICTMAGVTSLAREYLRDLLPRPEWHKIVVGCMTEIERAGRASGVDLAPTIVADTLAYMESAKGAMSASMHADLLAGRPMELEALNGAVVRAGESAGVPTPINDVIYAALKPYASGAA